MVSTRGRIRWIVVMAVAVALASSAGAQEGAPTRSNTPGEQAVTPPKLIDFVEAEYPAAAAQAGLEADVDLVLSIDAEGRVTLAEVSEARGHGFDEAARAAALGFRFEPRAAAKSPLPRRFCIAIRFISSLRPTRRRRLS